MEENSIRKMIEISSNIAGGAAELALSLLCPSGAGAVAGLIGNSTITTALQGIGNDIYDQILSQREVERIGTVASFFVICVNKNIENGKTIRNDGFFDSDFSARSNANEFFEGTFISAQKTFEEKKLKYLGNFMANIIFREDVSKELANYMIQLVGQLTFNQFCLLKIFNEIKYIPLKRTNYRDTEINKELVSILYELIDLDKRQMIINSQHHVLGLTDVIPNEYKAHGVGLLLYELFELTDMPYTDIKQNIELLS